MVILKAGFIRQITHVKAVFIRQIACLIGSLYQDKMHLLKEIFIKHKNGYLKGSLYIEITHVKAVFIICQPYVHMHIRIKTWSW